MAQMERIDGGTYLRLFLMHSLQSPSFMSALSHLTRRNLHPSHATSCLRFFLSIGFTSVVSPSEDDAMGSLSTIFPYFSLSRQSKYRNYSR